MRPADRVRAHVVEQYVDIRRGTAVTRRSPSSRETFLRALKLRGDYAPGVCSALRTGKFCKENELELTPPGRSAIHAEHDDDD